MKFPATGKPVTLLNWHHADKLYRLDEPEVVTMALQPLSSIFIHSYTFLPVHDVAGGLEVDRSTPTARERRPVPGRYSGDHSRLLPRRSR